MMSLSNEAQSASYISAANAIKEFLTTHPKVVCINVMDMMVCYIRIAKGGWKVCGNGIAYDKESTIHRCRNYLQPSNMYTDIDTAIENFMQAVTNSQVDGVDFHIRYLEQYIYASEDRMLHQNHKCKKITELSDRFRVGVKMIFFLTESGQICESCVPDHILALRKLWIALKPEIDRTMGRPIDKRREYDYETDSSESDLVSSDSVSSDESECGW